MKNECGIIRDLLPLYAENIASDDTVEFVEEHLKTCEACREEYGRIKEHKTVQADTDVAPLIKLRKKMRAKKIQTVAVTVILVIALLVSTLAVLTAPEYIAYSDNQVTVSVNEIEMVENANSEVVEIAYGEIVDGYDLDYVYDNDNNGHIYYFISFYNSIWHRWFDKHKEGSLSLEEGPSSITVYYVSNDGTENICIYGEPLDQNGGVTALPRLALGYYLIIAASLFVLLLTARGIFRKKENVKIWIERIALYPLSYVIAHLLILGFSFATYSIERDFPLIIFISLLLWCGLLFAHNIFKTRREIRELSREIDEQK